MVSTTYLVGMMKEPVLSMQAVRRYNVHAAFCEIEKAVPPLGLVKPYRVELDTQFKQT